MRKMWARGVLTIGVGLAGVLSQGCKRHADPAPPVQKSLVPRAAVPDETDPFPNDDPMPETMPREVHRPRAVLPRAIPSAPDPQQVAAEAEERQRQQDARLLEQQEAESQRAQEELNQQVELNQRAQEEMQAEPRIQNAPGPEQMGLPSGLESQGYGQRIQDAPGPDQTLRAQPGQPPPDRIQDAPGPAETMPQTAAQPQTM